MLNTASRERSLMPGHFTPAVFTFLKELAENNNREWWEDNKQRYIDTIREPARDFVVDFAPRLAEISPHFGADTRTNGGSLMRPYRDIRFSKDKTPYKTNVGIQFRHLEGRDVHAPGIYVHIEPRQCFLGVGMWTPEARVAGTIRQAINDDPEGWGVAAHSPEFTATWTIDGSDGHSLKRLPTGLDPGHPYVDDLRLRSFIAGARITQAVVTSSSFSDDLAKRLKKSVPFTRFLCDAIGVAF
jgi:uncharacterized protein (TIGR02453 family)